jgi:hypothetical protein
MTEAQESLAIRAVEKITKGGRHAATLISSDEIMAMVAMLLAMAESLGGQSPPMGSFDGPPPPKK